MDGIVARSSNMLLGWRSGCVYTGACRPGVTRRMTPMENEKSCSFSTFHVAD